MVIDNTPTVTSKSRKLSSRARLRLDTASRLKKLHARKRAVELKKARERVNSLLGSKSKEKSSSIKERKPVAKEATLKQPPHPTTRYRKRQMNKTWLPTHLFHTKRAHMTPPKEPLWRFALPLTPTEKCFRSSHRAVSMRGGIAWDMSYISTIGLTGREDRLEAVLKALGIGLHTNDFDIWRERGKKWKNGTRIWKGLLFRSLKNSFRLLGPAQVIWCAEPSSAAANQKPPPPSQVTCRKILLRVHPAIFPQVWEYLLDVSKSLNPAITVEDLRFEIGSIELVGPSSTEALSGALHTILGSNDNSYPELVEKVWRSIRSINNPAMIPHNALFVLDISDPRLKFPPCQAPSVDDASHKELLQTLTNWPLDKLPTQSGLFDFGVRHASMRALSSQKAINRRKRLAMPGEFPQPRSADPCIPVLAYSSCLSSASSRSSWTVLLPWKCVLPSWYSLMFYPLSTGGNLRFGGLHEWRQLAFEDGMPWFPGDFPGTEGGTNWELEERRRRESEWKRKPKGKRVEWESLSLGKGRRGEIGIGWACDWEELSANLEDQKGMLSPIS